MTAVRRSRSLTSAFLVAAACAGPGEREAGELGRLREAAAEGIEAVETFCTARDSAIAYVERGEPGADVVLEQVLLTPVVLDDYCEEFRYHEHDEESEDTAPAASPAGGDTAAVDSVTTRGR